MILSNDATVMVANGETLKLFRNKGVEPHIRLVELETPQLENQNQGSGSRHRSSAANPDDKRQSEDNFVAAVAGYINGLALAGEIVSLFVIADPRTLGELRRHFHAAVRAVLAGELAKDLTHHSLADLQSALTDA